MKPKICEYTEKEKGSKTYKRLKEKTTGYWMSSKKLKKKWTCATKQTFNPA